MQARIPTELHVWLKMEAIRQGTTLGELVNRVLNEFKTRKETEK